MRKLDAKHEFIQQNVPISSLAWLRVGGPIEYLATPRSEEELVAALQMCREDGVDARPLGDGASVIAAEPGAPGLAVKLSEPAFTEIRFESTRVVAGAGVKLGKLATATASAGLGGLEGLVAIPGTVGAAAVANVSTSSATVGQWIESARVATYAGEIFDVSKDELVFERGGSNLENVIVLSVTFQLEPDDPKSLAKRLQKTWIVRKKDMPELESGGMARMFKDPQGQRADELIAEGGFAGTRIGGAAVCESFPNLILTSDGCACDDVKRLLTLIETQTNERFHVKLERELKFW